jgi:uncharacterized protein YjiS (DUF1127 family)
MRKLLALWFAAFTRAQRARADRYVLEHLDTHTLRDIGLESWNPELAERVAQRRRRQQIRLAAAHIGLY